jgi:hypothetical protein
MNWVLVYAHDKAGNPLKGSLAELRSAVRAGSPARVRIDYDVEGPAIYRDIAALWIKGDHVYAQCPPIISAAFQDQFVGDPATVNAEYESGGLRFLDDPYYYFEICSTLGDVDKSRWRIADHKLRRRNQGKFALEWFVQK